MNSGYDKFAATYNQHWESWIVGSIIPVVKKLLLAHLPFGAHILEVGCGTGWLAAELGRLGYRVSGLDSSEEMLRFARQNAPQAEFIHGDALTLETNARFDAAVSTGDALNHLIGANNLALAFANIHDAVRSEGWLFVDMATETYYQNHDGQRLVIEDEGQVTIIRLQYDHEHKLRTSLNTTFRQERECWARKDFVIEEMGYSREEILSLIGGAGFEAVRAYDAVADFHMQGQSGRWFIVAQKKRTHCSAGAMNPQKRPCS